MGAEEFPVLPDALEYEELEGRCRRIRSARTRGELGRLVAEEVLSFSMFDLQVISGTVRNEIKKLPSPYRESVSPYFIDQIFGMHHQLLAQFHNGEFENLRGAPISDRKIFDRFCDMVPRGCFSWNRNSDSHLTLFRPQHRFFYYLIACYAMFVRECPGHPVGMPFPGPYRVEKREGTYLCPIRDKEKEVFYSICNFCPALQKEMPDFSTE
ncbi:MAG: DUF2115 family protein [Methanomicrobiales archaeon]|nr:DUF2115 family protein [Methanomicrobiales archaeon]